MGSENGHPGRIVVIGHANACATQLLRNAVSRRAGATMHVIPWADLLAGRADLRQVVRARDVVRIESPGKDDQVERLLLLAGKPDDAAWTFRIQSLAPDRGRIWWSAVWYHGLCNTLDRITSQLKECPRHQITSEVDDIKTMFDKTATHERLRSSAVPIPPAIGRISGYEHLLDEMRSRGWNSVFVKLAYGSSASGSIAFRTSSSGRLQAFTTVELDGFDPDGEPRMYNTRRIRRLSSSSDIARVVDAIARHVAHAERWIPKAGVNGRTFDLRVLVIAGRPCHTVVRMSRSPMTNLHLLNARSDAAQVRDRCGTESWMRMMASCVAAAGAFPRSLHAGVDLLIAPDFRRHAVLEVNAFGDLLQGAVWNGLDPYDAELAAVFADAPFAASAQRMGVAV